MKKYHALAKSSLGLASNYQKKIDLYNHYQKTTSRTVRG